MGGGGWEGRRGDETVQEEKEGRGGSAEQRGEGENLVGSWERTSKSTCPIMEGTTHKPPSTAHLRRPTLSCSDRFPFWRSRRIQTHPSWTSQTVTGKNCHTKVQLCLLLPTAVKNRRCHDGRRYPNARPRMSPSMLKRVYGLRRGEKEGRRRGRRRADRRGKQRAAR